MSERSFLSFNVEPTSNECPIEEDGSIGKNQEIRGRVKGWAKKGWEKGEEI